jgi:hypothetical protein
MDLQRMLQQIGGRLLRRFLTKGVLTAVNKTAAKGKRRSGASTGAGDEAAQRMRQTQKMMRRFRR